jgi:hypothetical protein
MNAKKFLCRKFVFGSIFHMPIAHKIGAYRGLLIFQLNCRKMKFLGKLRFAPVSNVRKLTNYKEMITFPEHTVSD